MVLYANLPYMFYKKKRLSLCHSTFGYPLHQSPRCELNNTLACYEIVHQSSGNAEDPHKQITDGKVQDEDISDRPHVPVPQDDETHHTVAYHAEQKDEQIGQDEHGSHAQ